MNTLRLGLRQVGYENRAFWRNPAAAFFTFVFPLMFLFLFNVLFGNAEVELPTGGIGRQSSFYVPAIISLAVVSACYTNIAMTVTFSRDRGVLKRLRGTPLPAGAFLIGRIGQAVLTAFILVVIVVGAGTLLFDARIALAALPAFSLSLVVGAGAFAALGLAITSFVPSADAAPAVVNGSVLPLLFISDVFINSTNAPAWLNTTANVFPIRHFSLALQAAFNPGAGAALSLGHLAVVFAWGLIGVVLAVRFFSWEPRR